MSHDQLALFRTEVSAWLKTHCPASQRQPIVREEQIWGGRRRVFPSADAKQWFEACRDRGYTAPEWPVEYGGAGLTPEQAKILKQEMARLQCRPPLYCQGLWMLGPALLVYGSEAQKREHFMVGPLMTKSMKPDFQIPKKWFDTGFVAKANSIRELADALGINADGLEETIANMNRYAQTGTDEEFGRGDSAYDRYYAAPAIKPNPCLAPIVKAPFYAMRIQAGDFGTLGGLDTRYAHNELALNHALHFDFIRDQFTAGQNLPREFHFT